MSDKFIGFSFNIYLLKYDNQIIEQILSKFIHKINVSNEAIEVEYNLSGFFD